VKWRIGIGHSKSYWAKTFDIFLHVPFKTFSITGIYSRKKSKLQHELVGFYIKFHTSTSIGY